MAEPRPPLGAAGEAGVTKPVWSIEEIEGAKEEQPCQCTITYAWIAGKSH